MRTIDEIIMHCSATVAGRSYTARDIRQWHLQRGFADIGYHFVVLLDGTVECGRPLERAGAHCLGRNAHSIGICYIGGLDAAGHPTDTRTPEQRQALRCLVGSLRGQFGQIPVHGHRYYANKACPCFDAESEFA